MSQLNPENVAISKKTEHLSSHEKRTDSHLCREILGSLARYVRGQLLIVLIMSALYTTGFFFLRVPLWWLAGSLCGLFHLVPLAGTLVAAVIPVGFQLLGGGGFWDIIRVLVLIAVVQLLETFYLTPKILGRELQLHPLVVILAVLGGALLAGPVGALLAVPVVAVGLLVWRKMGTGRKNMQTWSAFRQK